MLMVFECKICGWGNIQKTCHQTSWLRKQTRRDQKGMKHIKTAFVGQHESGRENGWM